MKIMWQSVLIIILLVLLITIQILYWLNPVTISDIIAMQGTLFYWINHHYALSTALYTLCYVLSIVFGIPISITTIGGYLFGTVSGIIYSMIGIAFGALILITSIRFLFHDWVKKYYHDQLQPINKEIETYGIFYIVFIHMIPFMPSFLANIALAVSDLHLWKIISITIIGAFPLTCLYSFAGAYIHHLESAQTIIYFLSGFLGILGILFLSSMAIKRIMEK